MPSDKLNYNNKIIYKGDWIKTLRVISRGKILHLALVSCLCAPLSQMYLNGLVDSSTMTNASIGVIGSAGMLGIFSRGAMKYIGQISQGKNSETVNVSTLNFWGKSFSLKTE